MNWEELRQEWESDSDVLVCHTSGSTGKPSRVELPKTQVAASARRTLSFFGLDSSSHFYSCLAPDYIGGKMMLIRAILAGGYFSWETPSNTPLRDAGTDRIDLLCVVPSQMQYILDNADRLPEIGNILIGGSAIPETLRTRIAGSSLNSWETYGMTETASHIAIRRVSADTEPFRPLPGIGISTNEGRLVIDIPGWRRFETNDLVEINDDGSFRILGRADNVIITGGLKVHPEQVEAVLSRYLDFPFCISSMPDPKWGSRVVLEVEHPDMDADRILRICRNTLSKHEIPKEIIPTTLERTDNGKIRRRRH